MLGFEKERNRAEKGPFPDSIITREGALEMQSVFELVIPKLLWRIKKEKVTHILLTEKTARLFKVGFQRLLKRNGLNHVKVGSFAFDYLGPGFRSRKSKFDDFDTANEQKEKKLFGSDVHTRFLPNQEDSKYKIMIIDEFRVSGDTLRNAKKYLSERGFNSKKIITDYLQCGYIDGQETYIEALIANNIFQSDFQSDFKYRHPLFVDKVNSPKQYRDTSEQISDMMLQSLSSRKIYDYKKYDKYFNNYIWGEYIMENHQRFGIKFDIDFMKFLLGISGKEDLNKAYLILKYYKKFPENVLKQVPEIMRSYEDIEIVKLMIEKRKLFDLRIDKKFFDNIFLLKDKDDILDCILFVLKMAMDEIQLSNNELIKNCERIYNFGLSKFPKIKDIIKEIQEKFNIDVKAFDARIQKTVFGITKKGDFHDPDDYRMPF